MNATKVFQTRSGTFKRAQSLHPFHERHQEVPTPFGGLYRTIVSRPVPWTPPRSSKPVFYGLQTSPFSRPFPFMPSRGSKTCFVRFVSSIGSTRRAPLPRREGVSHAARPFHKEKKKARANLDSSSDTGIRVHFAFPANQVLSERVP